MITLVYTSLIFHMCVRVCVCERERLKKCMSFQVIVFKVLGLKNSVTLTLRITQEELTLHCNKFFLNFHRFYWASLKSSDNYWPEPKPVGGP